MISSNETLSPSLFDKFSSFVLKEVGVSLGPVKRTMVESRLRKRLHHLNIPTYEQYFHFLQSSEGQISEMETFVHTITTHKTDFWREPAHFKFIEELLQTPWPEQFEGTLNFWSAACSRGDEPYTLAMILCALQEKTGFSKKFKLYASDISAPAIAAAKNAVFNENAIAPIPMEYRKKFLLRSKNPQSQLFRIHPTVRQRIHFFSHNLMNPCEELEEPIHIIFLRNVLIYFNQNHTNVILKQLFSKLSPNGLLITGHSEVLNTSQHPLKAIAPTVYRYTPNA